MGRGDWWAPVHGVEKSWTQLSTQTHTHTHIYKDASSHCVGFDLGIS